MLAGFPPLFGGLYLLWSLFLLKDPSQIQTFIDIPLGLMGGFSKFQKMETSSIHRYSRYFDTLQHAVDAGDTVLELILRWGTVQCREFYLNGNGK